MSYASTLLLGGLAGLSIFLGLPVARLPRRPARLQGWLNGIATGILIFLLFDVLAKASEPVHAAVDPAHRQSAVTIAGYLALLIGGLGVGLMSLVFFNKRVGERLRLAGGRLKRGPGAAVAAGAVSIAPGRSLALMIAAGLGLHNFSEGLAIGQAAATGAIAFATVLIAGFALHNVTEGFGLAAPMASDSDPPSWLFLGLAGLMAGGPTFLGTLVGYSFTSTYVFVLFLALAAGALIYVINEMLQVGRRMNGPVALGWCLLLGFTAAYATDLFLTYAGA